MKKKPSSVDVALLAGVSQSAVSRVFTQGAHASKATTEKVLRAASELGYRPNKLARSLIEGRTRIIGAILSGMENTFYTDALEEISDQLSKRGYGLMVLLPREDHEVDAAIAELLSYRVTGILSLSPSFSHEIAAKCREWSIPAVMLFSGKDGSPMNRVVTDNYSAAADIARYLVAGGHRRIAHLSGEPPRISSAERAAGFKDGLRQAGVELFAEEAGGNTRELAIAATHRMFAAPPYPDAVFVANDQMAFAVIEVLHFDLGMRIPEDVSVIGFDDARAASWRCYDLTTWRQPVAEIVATGIDLLLSMSGKPARPPVSIVVNGQMVERGSARKPGSTPSGGA